MNSYDLHRQWFDFAFKNQGKVTPVHTAMYAWFVELNNRMGWVEQFNSPASQTMAAIGIKHHSTYKKSFNDLVEFGFVKIIEEAKNQWTSCIIALSKFDKAHSEALDKAIARHVSGQPLGTYHSTPQGTCDINKPLNNKPLNQETNPPISPRGGGSADKNFSDETEVESTDEKIKKVAPKKEKSEPPAIEEFVAYGLANITGVTSYRSDLWENALRLKYKAWLEAGWMTGGKKPREIAIWKTTLLNTIPHLERDVSMMMRSQPNTSKLDHNLSVMSRAFGIN